MTQQRKPKPSPKIDLAAYERNPNSMADDDKAMLAKSLAEHGDLSGIVWNRRNGKLVGGHQRIDVLRRLGDGDCPVKIDKELETPTRQGTVGWGSVTFGGESFPVRVVEWTEAQHQQAMIAANRFGRIGVDDQAVIKDLLEELDDGSRDMELTGYSEKAIEELMTQFHVEDEAEAYTNKIVAPVYEPKGEKPELSELIDRTKTEQLIEEINKSEIPEDVKQFMRYSAERHTVFNFRQIAEYYCHADPVLQDLMERSGMVIIDFKKAIECGFVHLTKRLGELADLEDSEDADA